VECLYPHLSRVYAYSKGCRCESCKKAHSEALRLYRGRNLEACRAKSRARNHVYYRENRTYENLRLSGNYAKRRASTPISVSGVYSDAEVSVILSWRGRTEDLARALGRGYASVRAKKAQLRRAGLL